MLYDVVYDAEQAMAQYLEENGTLVSACDVGLDPRAGMLYVTDDAIVVRGRTGSLEYYGGFEYVDSELTAQVGEYKVYFADDERVAGCLELYREQAEAA